MNDVLLWYLLQSFWLEISRPDNYSLKEITETSGTRNDELECAGYV